MTRPTKTARRMIAAASRLKGFNGREYDQALEDLVAVTMGIPLDEVKEMIASASTTQAGKARA